MIFQDNVIKEYLKNVYFITGTPCGGKTTISRELAKRYNLLVYDIDEHFGRTVEEYKEGLIDNTREQLDFVLLDLIRLSQNKIVLCDCHLTVEEAEKYTEASRIVFLIKEPSNLIEDYCNRPDKQGFSDFINSASDIEKAKATCNVTLKTLNEKRCNNIKGSNYLWIEITKSSTIEETVRKVEQHFGFEKKDFGMDTLEIRKVDRDTDLADKLICFVENLSWEEVKEHMLWVLRTWVFIDWKTVFVAMVDGQIVGMTSIMKEDYYPLPEIYPWISSVFVAEEYRGHRINEKLIDFANVYAKENGFNRTYIPSEHIGLYEKYGYHYLKDIVNFGNGTDRLYAKELKL